MAYTYLTEMFQYIENRFSEAVHTCNSGEADKTEKQFHEGRIEALSDFKQFLEKNYIQKLPSRIRKFYMDKTK